MLTYNWIASCGSRMKKETNATNDLFTRPRDIYVGRSNARLVVGAPAVKIQIITVQRA